MDIGTLAPAVPVDLEALLRRVASGDADAFSQLYDRTAATVYGLVVRILGEEAEAEEVAQEVYLQVWRKADSFDPDRGSAVAWLATIARSRSLDRLRTRASYRGAIQRLSGAAVRQPVADPAGDPEEMTGLAQRRAIVRRALSALPEAQREAIRLAYYGGMSHSEISEATGTPLGTVKTRIRAAVAKLEEMLGPTTGAKGAL